MNLQEIDKSELILESFRIEGIQLSECRSIFLDWALKLPDGVDQKTAIRFLIEQYSEIDPDHPMRIVLKEGLGAVSKTGRRGGRANRIRNLT